MLGDSDFSRLEKVILGTFGDVGKGEAADSALGGARKLHALVLTHRA
jgi:hypothetical protein